MKKIIKVYGVTGYRKKLTREIVATTSKAKAAKLFSRTTNRPNTSHISETRNTSEVTLAMSQPGNVFWHFNDAPLTNDLMQDIQYYTVIELQKEL